MRELPNMGEGTKSEAKVSGASEVDWQQRRVRTWGSS
jgi:hypothetical protein